ARMCVRSNQRARVACLGSGRGLRVSLGARIRPDRDLPVRARAPGAMFAADATTLNVLVCVKRVPATAGKITLTGDEQAIDTRYLGFTVSPHEECAVEEAV